MKSPFETKFFNLQSPLMNHIEKQEIPVNRDFLLEDVTISPEEMLKTLELRIVELESENKKLRENDNRPWCFDLNQPGWVRGGLTQKQYMELDSVARHFVTKTNSNVWLMMAHTWQSPISTREKLVLFFLCLVNAKQNEPVPQPGQPTMPPARF